MKALDECKGQRNTSTDEGDRFNLKSKLSQITGIMKLIEGGIFATQRFHARIRTMRQCFSDSICSERSMSNSDGLTAICCYLQSLLSVRG